MCGIVGYIGHRCVLPILLDGLRRLEYRGYDSAGVAYILEGSVHRVRSEGKLGKLDLLLDGVRDVPSPVGLGHTRKLPNRKRLQGAADARRRVRRRTPCTSSARQQSRCGAP